MIIDAIYDEYFIRRDFKTIHVEKEKRSQDNSDLRGRTSPQVGLNERKNIILQKANGLLSEDESIMKKSIESTMHSYDPNVTGSKD